MTEILNAVTFQAFLRKLLRHRTRGKRMIVVLDNARYHHAILLRPLLQKYRHVLSLLFLPPYSPQLAPIERVWKLARRLATHNRYFETLAEVVAAVDQCFDHWSKPNAVLRSLCCII
ncbi:MAG: transposase [Burkholderiaceae bacterium]|jgi:transposase